MLEQQEPTDDRIVRGRARGSCTQNGERGFSRGVGSIAAPDNAFTLGRRLHTQDAL
jgi:hypothetical protein